MRMLDLNDSDSESEDEDIHDDAQSAVALESQPIADVTSEYDRVLVESMKQLNTATLDQARVHRRSASLRGYNMAAVTKAPKAPRPTTKARAKARAKASAKNKFVPIEPLPMRELQVAPAVDGEVPHGASILIVQEPWISLILSGHKKYEIRGSTCKKRGRVFLAVSGGGGKVVGSVEVVQTHGPLDVVSWKQMAEGHCVAGEKLPYGAKTHAWQLASPIRFRTPMPYTHKQGCVVWATA